jgi:hypothetical protein
MKEIVLKDNGSWGAWDFDELANKWDDLPLTDWGVPAWNTGDEEALELDTEEPKKADNQNVIHCPKCGFEFIGK